MSKDTLKRSQLGFFCNVGIYCGDATRLDMMIARLESPFGNRRGTAHLGRRHFTQFDAKYLHRWPCRPRRVPWPPLGFSLPRTSLRRESPTCVVLEQWAQL